MGKQEGEGGGGAADTVVLEPTYVSEAAFRKSSMVLLWYDESHK